MKALIYGFGKTGQSFKKYLRKKDISFDIYDTNLKKYNFKYNIKDYDQVYCSPGIPRKIFDDLNAHSEVFTDMDVFFKEDRSIKIGITGTNGKSTICFHLSQIMEEDFEVNLAGNIGNPVLDFINNGAEYTIIELSSFQLDKMKLNTLDYGVLLNIEPDHLDYHGSFDDYFNAKQKIRNAKKFSDEVNPYALSSWITGVQSKKFSLKNLPYRYEHISKNIINDSKSTNNHSLKYALNKASAYFDHKDFILLICGDPKKEDYPELHISSPSQVLIFGKHSDSLLECIIHSNSKVFNDLESTLDYVKDLGKDIGILFSPGFPSGLDYKNFEERGNHFNQLIKEKKL